MTKAIALAAQNSHAALVDGLKSAPSKKTKANLKGFMQTAVDQVPADPEPPIVSVQGIVTSVLEGAPGVKFKARAVLSKPADRVITVPWTTLGSGKFPADKADFDGRMPGSFAVFNKGETTFDFDFSAVNDLEVEPDETFDIVLLAADDGSYALGTGSRVTCTIANDDTPPAPTPAPSVVIVDVGNDLSWFYFTLKLDGSVFLEEHHATGKTFSVPNGSSANFTAAGVTLSYDQLVARAGGAPQPTPIPTPDPAPTPGPSPTPGPLPTPEPGTVALTASPITLQIDLPGGTKTFEETKATAAPFRGVLPWDPYTNMTLACQKLAGLTVMFLRGGYAPALGFHYGELFKTDNLGAYAVRVYQDGKLVATLNPPRHNHFGFWSWPNSCDAPWPILVDRDTLLQRFVLPFDPSNTMLEGLMSTVSPYALMGASNITVYMAQTGERWDIGPIPEPTAQYLYFGNLVAEKQMRAWSEAAGSIPLMFIDDDGRLVNLAKRPTAGLVPDQTPAGQLITMPATEWQPDPAHQPSLSYVPYLLRCHPFDLLKLQAFCLWNHLSWRVLDRGQGAGTLGISVGQYAGYTGQARALWWTLLRLVEACICTPDNVPAPFVPGTEFKRLFENQRQWILKTRVNATSDIIKLSRSAENFDGPSEGFAGGTMPGETLTSPWQSNQGAMVLLIAARNFPEWASVEAWFGEMPRAFCGLGTGIQAGWDPELASPYRAQWRDTGKSAAYPNLKAASDKTKAVIRDIKWVSGRDCTYETYANHANYGRSVWKGDTVALQAYKAQRARMDAIGARTRRKYA